LTAAATAGSLGWRDAFLRKFVRASARAAWRRGASPTMDVRILRVCLTHIWGSWGDIRFGWHESKGRRTLERDSRRTQKVPVSRQSHLGSFPLRLLTLVLSFLLSLSVSLQRFYTASTKRNTNIAQASHKQKISVRLQ
jgi:hypothetical protein